MLHLEILDTIEKDVLREMHLVLKMKQQSDINNIAVSPLYEKLYNACKNSLHRIGVLEGELTSSYISSILEYIEGIL